MKATHEKFFHLLHIKDLHCVPNQPSLHLRVCGVVLGLDQRLQMLNHLDCCLDSRDLSFLLTDAELSRLGLLCGE